MSEFREINGFFYSLEVYLHGRWCVIYGITDLTEHDEQGSPSFLLHVCLSTIFATTFLKHMVLHRRSD